MNRSLPALRRIALGLLAGFTLASPALGAGDLDTNFNPNVYLNNIGFGGASGIPYACAVQRDNKIIIAGYFDTVGGVARNSMARLNTDGSVDSGFDPSPNGLVTTVLVQPDGKILVKGLFTTIAGVSCTNFARLNADGTFDTGFTSPTVNFDIYGIGLQPDGKIVIGGYFTSVNSTTRNRIARLNSDGSLDTGFNPNANGTVGSVFVQADGKIIVSGAFTTVGGVARTRFARLNSDGTLDTGFVPASGTAQPSAVAVQANGKVIFADSSFYPQLNRLNADGSVDTGFAPPVLEGPGFTDSYGVYGLTVQADGKILVSGGFLYADSAANRWIIRLASNGALDSSFAPDNYYSYGGYLNGATLQQNGGVLIFGSLQNVGITTRNGMARLSNDAATETLTVPSSSRVEWLRGGSTPEAEWVGFELSTNGGSSWSFLGSGTRITGGWELTGLSLPSDGLVRARAQARTNGSSSLIETVVPFPGEIAVRGNNVDIADGDTTPSVTDYTELEPVGVTGGTGSRLFTIANVGGRALTISGLSISGTHAADFSVGSPPGTPLAAHSTWSFSVNFNPSALGTRSATVTITSDDPDEGTFEFDIQGEGIEPEINIKGNSVTIADGDTTPSTGDHTDFGVTSSGAGAVVRTFTIENTGVNDLVISNMWMNDFSSEFVLGGISFPATVAPSSSTTFTVTFKPSGAGTRSSTVQVFSNDGDEGDPYDFKVQGFSDPEIDILGNGISIADGDTTPSTSDHTDLGMPAVSGGSVVQIFTIQNTGTTDLIVSNLASTGTHWWNFTTGGLSLPAVVAPSSSTTFTVTFTPSAAGLRTASILVYSNDGNEGNFYDFAVQGIAGPEMNVQGNSTTIVDSDSTPDAADHTEFGSVSVASGTLSRTFTIQNTSTLGTLNLSSIIFSGAAAGEFSVSGISLPATVAPGSSTTFVVTFDPSSGGTRLATLSIGNNDPNEAPYDFAIQGTGTGVEIHLTGNSVAIADGDTTPDIADHTDFGGVLIASGTLVRTYTIANLGTTSLSVTGITKSGTHMADFTVGGITFPRTIAAGTSTTFTVTFNPAAVGLRTAALAIANTDLDENPYNLSIQGTGTEPEIAVLGNGSIIVDGDVTPSTLDHTNFDSVMLGDETQRTYTITNTGTGPLSITGISKSGTALANYTVTGISFPTSIPAGSNTTFSVVFAPSAAGARPAALSIANTDASENPYTFSLTGTGVAPGATDTTFNPNANSSVYGLAVQPDEQVLLTGTFTNMNSSTRNYAARMTAGGSLNSFDPNANNAIYTTSVQSDGSVILGGDFSTVSSTARSRIARVDSSGTLDGSFNPGANGSVRSTAIQPDGKILVAGAFTTLGGSTCNGIGRLNTDGTLDTSFNPNANSTVYAVAVEPDGQILIGGLFTSVGGSAHNYLARLNSDGTVDSSFNPSLNNPAYCIAVQPDGEILVGGSFTSISSTTRNRIARLNSDGTLDSFNPNSNGTAVYSISVQADERIIVGGDFTTIVAVARNRIARLNSGGTLDTTFNPNASTASSSVYGLALQKDGEVLVAGDFTTIGGVARNRIARLDNNVAAESLTATSSARLEWLRGGAAPEAQDVTFEISTDGGSNWTLLGSGTRISGGWEITGLSLPGSGLICARARTTGGLYTGSSGIVESIFSF